MCIYIYKYMYMGDDVNDHFTIYTRRDNVQVQL